MSEKELCLAHERHKELKKQMIDINLLKLHKSLVFKLLVSTLSNLTKLLPCIRDLKHLIFWILVLMAKILDTVYLVIKVYLVITKTHKSVLKMMKSYMMLRIAKSTLGVLKLVACEEDSVSSI